VTVAESGGLHVQSEPVSRASGFDVKYVLLVACAVLVALGIVLTLRHTVRENRRRLYEIPVRSEFGQIWQAVKLYRNAEGKYPPTMGELFAEQRIGAGSFRSVSWSHGALDIRAERLAPTGLLAWAMTSHNGRRLVMFNNLSVSYLDERAFSEECIAAPSTVPTSPPEPKAKDDAADGRKRSD
jgi:hypothetical protein